jgi:thiamine biosynthesis lipoprotein
MSYVEAGFQARPLVLLVAALATACSATPERDHTKPSSAPYAFSKETVTMGSSLQVTLWTANDPGATAAIDAVFAEFDRLDHLMSVWKEGSDVLRLNAAAGREPVRVSPETLEVLTVARQVSDWTDGTFDVTFGALSGLWKFDQDQDDSIPPRSAVAARLPDVDHTALDIDAASGTAFLRRPGMRAHLGGIGKGYAIDRAIAILKAAGFTDFVIQSGGDLYVAGSNGSQPWSLGIADPRRPDRVFARVQLANATFSTSGDYERAFMKNGVRYHHLLDPDRGEPARGCRSVTIVADRAILADVLSTGVFIMGPADGMALIEKLPGVEGVIVSAKNEVLISSGLRGRVEIAAPPIDAP